MTKVELDAENIAATDNDRIDMHAKRMAFTAFGLSGATLTLAILLAGSNANAQTRPSYANEFSRPYGLNVGDEISPFDARTRDLNGNRTVVDGVIVTGDDLSSLPLGMYNTGTNYSGTGTAVGNQLNVSTTGSYNTVVVNSSQVNNGNQTVIIQNGSNTNAAATTNSQSQSQVLNGGLNF